MAQRKQEANSIYEARDDEMVSLKDGKSTVRIARFLRPCTRSVSQAVSIPHTPLLSEILSHDLQQWPSLVLFKGWKQPQKKWKEWVDRLAEKHGAIWNQTGIYDAIMSSIYEMRCNQDLLLGLSEFWCSKTNTFVFPWGEATITLEDVMIIGGYPVLGNPVMIPLPGRLVKIEEAMNRHRIELIRSKAKKALHSGWLSKFMEEETEYEYEHVAFLSLWLSRYVFPSLPEETIGKHVFPIATQLSHGIRLALAPAVLASLYQNLTMLKEKAMVSAESIVVSGPFPLLQLWAFERFPLVGPNPPNSLKPGEPRAAQWHKLSSKFNLPLVRSALRLPENFRWRPYSADLKNWRQPSFYRETKQFVYNGLSLDEELQSFFRCLHASELVGIGCKEKYMPHRVAMQFGMDQDLPRDGSVFTSSRENVIFFVPPKSFEPGVSSRYFNWWKDSMCARKDVVQKRIMKSKSLPSAQTKMKKKDCLKRCNTLSRASGKSANKVSLKTAASRITRKSKMSSSVQAKNCKDDSHAAVSSRTQKSPKEFFRVSSKSNIEESHASATPSSIIFQDSSDDDIPLVDRLARKASSGKAFSKVVNENCRKRKFHSTREENPQGKATVGLVKVAKNVERKADDSTNGPKVVARDVKRKADHSVKGSKGVARDVKREACESGRDVAKEGEGKKFIKAGESFNNPINIDGYVGTSTSQVQKPEIDLEGRVQKLEELLGVEIS